MEQAILRRATAAAAAALLAAATWALLAATAHAGVVNPNISVVGQPRISLTDDPDNPDRQRPRLDIGETEFVYDDYLNPYVRGNVTLSLSPDEGMALEEGYLTFLRGLPAGLNLKYGKYRAGFGKLNPQHPHTYPFAERFGVLASYLPGEAFNETGLQVSKALPAPGDMSLIASVDWLQGDTFRREREDSGLPGDPLAADPQGDRPGESRPAVLARLSSFAMLGDRSGLEVGLSATEGTNNVAAGTRTRALGVDAKAKLWRSERSYLVLQGEALKLRRDDAGWDGTGYTGSRVTPWGWYLYGDYNFDLRWNVGASYERYQQDDADGLWNHAVGVFAGFALMEETTALRADWERRQVAAAAGEPAPDAVNTFTLRIIWSMGPHKAHQF